MAHENGCHAVMSHRSGETEDTTIADLAVATGCRPDQDRRTLPQRPGGEVQPAAADRGPAGRRRGLRTVGPAPKPPRHPPRASAASDSLRRLSLAARQGYDPRRRCAARESEQSRPSFPHWVALASLGVRPAAVLLQHGAGAARAAEPRRAGARARGPASAVRRRHPRVAELGQPAGAPELRTCRRCWSRSTSGLIHPGRSWSRPIRSPPTPATPAERHGELAWSFQAPATRRQPANRRQHSAARRVPVQHHPLPHP